MIPTSRYRTLTGLRFIDIFAGGGGSSTGLVEAGYELISAYNHWEKAVETHAANHRDADHVLADVSNYDMRLLPRGIDLAWMSPECTWHSPAGGRKRQRQPQLDLFDEYVPNAAGERSRMTMWDVVRATEARRFPIVIVENVVEVTGWELFHAWLGAMDTLGYTCQVVNVSAAHVWSEMNPAAPQWRDRVYFVFTRHGVTPPDVAPRPLAWCEQCGDVIAAKQSWKRPDVRFGKYGQQYVYVCAEGSHRPCRVEPYVSPAADAIDWTDLGVRIGDRESLGMRPLAAATLRRIRVGAHLYADGSFLTERRDYQGADRPRLHDVLDPAPTMTATGRGIHGLTVPPLVVAHTGETWDAANPRHPRHGDPGSYYRVWPAGTSPLMARAATFGEGVAIPPFMVSVNHGGHDGRHFLPDDAPLPARSTKVGDGVVVPYIAELWGTGTARPVTDPAAAVTAGGNHHGLTIPDGAFVQKHHGGVDYPRPEHMVKPVSDALPSIVARPNVSLVVPYRKGARPRPVDGGPLDTVTTRQSNGLLNSDLASPDISDLADFRFRMLSWREHATAQRFPTDYRFTGNKSENSAMAGNAVASNVAHWLGRAVAPSLEGAPA